MYFIAGLPRSGSTLLSAILRQNPTIHAAMTSPVEHIFTSTITSMSGSNQFSRFITDVQRERVLRNVFDSFYAEVPSQLIVDTNRNWPAKLPALVNLFPYTKIICCVRDLVSVMNSFEHLVAANPFTVSRMFRSDATMTVYGRYERLMSADGPLGRALHALSEGYYSVHRDRLHFVEYDALVADPERTMSALYSAIGQPHFKHDFNALVYQENAFDTNLNLRDMHTVRTTVAPLVRPLIVPDDLVARLRGKEFWRHG